MAPYMDADVAGASTDFAKSAAPRVPPCTARPLMGARADMPGPTLEKGRKSERERSGWPVGSASRRQITVSAHVERLTSGARCQSTEVRAAGKKRLAGPEWG
jgi:hypothetical protein